MANYHIMRNNQKDSWEVKREGSSRVSAWADTQHEAEEIAKKMCANSGGGEVRIHGRDGHIRDSDTVAPGNDPFPPRDIKF